MKSLPASPPVSLLMAVGLVGPLATHMVVPALPNLQRHFQTDYGTAQLLVSLFMITFGAAQILVGPLADAYGRRRVLIGGLAMFSAISFLCTLATSVEMLIALRMLQGAFGCAGIVLGRAIVRDVYSDEDTPRMLGYMAIGVAIGPMIAPALGGFLFEGFGWTAAFWFLGALAALGTLFCFLLVPETSRREVAPFRFSVLFADFGFLLRQRDFLLCGACICFNTAMFYCFVIGAPFVSSTLLGLSPSAYGLWFSLVAIGYALGNFLAGRIAGLFSPRAFILTGSLSVALFVLVLAWIFWVDAASPAAMFLIMAVITFNSGLIMPQALAGTLKADPRKAGSASGLIGFTQFAFAAAFSYLAGIMIDGSASPQPLFAVMFAAALACIVAAGMLFMPRKA